MTSILNKRFPTLIGIFFLMLSIGATSLLAENGTFFESRAQESLTPENIRVTNTTDSTFTLSYTTKNKVAGTLFFGNTPSLGSIILDDRDQKAKISTSYTTHHITVKNLAAKTKNYFVIRSGSATIKNNDQPFEVVTGPRLQPNSKKQIISGKIVSPDGLPLPEIIGFATVDNGQILSVLISQNGTYEFAFDGLRRNSLASYLPLLPQTEIKLLFISSKGQSVVKIPFSESQTVPDITFLEQFDFTPQTPAPDAENPATSSADLSFFPVFSSSQLKKSGELGLFTSDFETGLGTTTKPLFRGTAEPEADVTLVLKSIKRLTAKIKANADGQWLYQFDQDLLPGKYTITISSLDSKTRLLKTVSAPFTILSSETR